MKRLALIDYGKTKCTNEVLGIIDAVLDELGFPQDQAAYFHAVSPDNFEQIKGFDVIVSLGADAMRQLCNVKRDLRDYAGVLTYNTSMDTWILPTFHPNGIYQEKYNEFDDIYAHLRRAVDLCTGQLQLPPVEGVDVDWEFIGHNGDGWDPNLGYDPVVWSGYNEVTEAQADRAVEVISSWLGELDVL